MKYYPILSIDLKNLFSELNDLITQPEELLQELQNLGIPEQKLTTYKNLLSDD